MILLLNNNIINITEIKNMTNNLICGSYKIDIILINSYIKIKKNYLKICT